MKKYSRLILSLWMCLPLYMTAQNAYTLRDCVQQGLDKNFNILIAQNELTMAENAATVSNSNFMPTLSLEASHQANWDATDQVSHSDSTTHISPYYTGATTVGLYLNWTIFDGMNNSATFQRYKAQLQLRDIELMIAMEDYILSVAQGYYTYVALKQQLDLQQQLLTLSAERMRIAKIQYESGAKSNVEFLQAKVDYNSDSTSYVQIKQSLNLQRLAMSDLMMLDDLQAKDWEISDKEIVCDQAIDFDDLWNTCLHKNSSLLLAQKQTNIAIIDIKSSRSNFYPTLNLSAGYGYHLNMASGGDYKSRTISDPSIGVTFSLPLINIQNIQSFKNVKLTKLNAELTQKDLERQLKLDFTDNWVRYQNYLSLVELERNNIVSAKASLDAATLQYKQSQISGIQLREAQISYLQDQYDLLEMNFNAKLQEIYLLYLAGNSTTLY